MTAPRTAALILAAGRSTRFGSPKALALLEGKPLLQHVVDVARTAAVDDIVVVLGAAARDIEPVIDWAGVRRVWNPAPQRGLASSLRLGLASLPPDAESVLILLGDQPRVDPAVIAALLDQPTDAARPIVAPRYIPSGGPNPLRVDRPGWPLAELAVGDSGLCTVLAARPELVNWIPFEGANPDVDTLADLEALRNARPTAGAPKS